MDFHSLRLALLGVAAYRDIVEQPEMLELRHLLEALCHQEGEAALEAYCTLFHRLKQRGQPGLGHWLADALRASEGPWPRLLEHGGEDSTLEAAARRDMDLFRRLADLDCTCLAGTIAALLPGLAAEALPVWDGGCGVDFESLSEIYRREGCGVFARYRAFVWEDGRLVPVAKPDCPGANELLGYDYQRNLVIENTRALMEDRYVNNVLLYGESGTGKSATVKHLLTLPDMEQLRIVEADKDDLAGLPTLIRSLQGRKQKFIIFIDDLTFDGGDSTYSILKTILEGGVEHRPDNVAIYATSNRRHLMRQTISERAGDDMDRNETIREKTSLADRFGLRILFQGLSKQEYLDTVDLLARNRGIAMAPEQLHAQAVTWERGHGSLTPRTALQFVLSLH